MASTAKKVPDVHTQHVLDRSEVFLRELVLACGDGRSAGLKDLVDASRRQEVRDRAEGLLLLLKIVRNDLSNP